MKEKILFENQFNESIVEPGFDQMFAPKTAGHPENPTLDAPAPGTSTQVTVNQQTQQSSGEGNTNTTDIARNAPLARLAQNAISKSLPFMIGYVQPIQGPGAYALGLTWKENTKIADAYANAALATRTTPGTNPGDDPVVVRQYIETAIREVNLDLTNETAQDIEALFGNNFPKDFAKFKASGGEVWDGPNGPLAAFFLTLGQQRMTRKINTDFVAWLDTIASVKGTHAIASYDKMNELIGVMGELRETLYKGTRKSGPVWALVSPRIANFLATTLHSAHSSSTAFQAGRRVQSNLENGYVTTIGDITIYQNPMVPKKNTDGSETYTDQLEATGEIFMGISGGPDSSSIYYYPYKEYIVQGGEDYYTGQSNVFFRVRDAWSTNPLDTLDKKQQTVNTPAVNKNSLYVVKANIKFDATANLLG